MGRPDIAGQLEPPFRPAFGQCDDQIGIEPVFDGADIPDYQALAAIGPPARTGCCEHRRIGCIGDIEYRPGPPAILDGFEQGPGTGYGNRRICDH